MMNAFGSELMSSGGGCESGWTLYLDHSNLLAYNGADNNMPPTHLPIAMRKRLSNDDDDDGDDDIEEEEDMSMMSDASSGPPNQYRGRYLEQAVEVNCNFYNNNNNNNEDTYGQEDCCYYGSYDCKEAISRHCHDSPSMGVAATVRSSKSKTSTSDGKRSKRNGKAGSSRSTTTHILDDTASSSPYFNYQQSNNIGVTNWQRQESMESLFDYSQGFSTTHDHHFPMDNKFNRRRIK